MKKKSKKHIAVFVIAILVIIGIYLLVQSLYNSPTEIDFKQRVQEEIELLNKSNPQNLEYEFVGPNTGEPQPFNTTSDAQIQN